MSSIFISQPIQNGHSWTITSKLGDILHVAQEKYGPRDYTYTLLGVEFNQETQPRIWYPKNGKNIIIQITLNCLNDLNIAVYQVAHEVIHCLSPITGQKHTNVLEEGLATLFSFEYAFHNGNGAWQPEIEKYQDAYRLVRQLISIDADIIKKLRQLQPTISKIDKDLILSVNPNVPIELAENLTQVF